MRIPIIGIDGCPGGWCAVIFKENHVDIKKYLNLMDLVNDYPKASHYIIDMPMGLSDSKIIRDLDSKVRRMVKPRQSTIFNAPCRQVLKTNTYQEANKVNKEITGKGLSIQSWNLVPKIKELDSFLDQKPEYKDYFYESSPELCFAGINNGEPVIESKISPVGIKKRIELLSTTTYFNQDMVKQVLRDAQRSKLKIDDLLDAYILCVTGILGVKYQFQFQFNSSYRKDSKGIPLRVIYYQQGIR